MAKGKKIQTPDWVLEGYNSKKEYEEAKGKSDGKKESGEFKVKVCPSCGGFNVFVLLNGKEGRSAKNWECKDCKWNGSDIGVKWMDEESFFKYIEERGEE